MRVILFTVATFVIMIAFAAVAFAGFDFDFSARHKALAGTGNAAFNPRGLSPSLENIACVVGNPNYNILLETDTQTINSFSTVDNVDYYSRDIFATSGLKTTYSTLQRDDEDTFAERLSFTFIPGVHVENNYQQASYADTDEETSENTTLVQAFQRFGVGYGINEIVAVGVGFSLLPLNMYRVAHKGDYLGVDTRDDYTMLAPVMFSPEIGVLVRPIDFIQLGLAYENGDLKSRQADISHTFADGDNDVKTEAIVARSPSLGFGFAIDIPDFDKFYVSFDFDQEWRRGEASNYSYYADNQEQQWTVAVEKVWEMSSVKGGLGYSDEVGTRRYRPNDSFFFTFGTDLLFDEHIMMGLALRGDVGHLEARPSGTSFGGGVSWTLGGTF